jgi:RND family efflux transporter MFP subunit
MAMSAFPYKPLNGMPAGRRFTRWLSFTLAVFWAVGGHAEAVINVRTVALGAVVETPMHSAPASVVARNTPQIAAEIAARVIALPVRVGDRVEPGDALARLDCRRHESLLDAARAALARAEAQQRFAQRQLNRARNLQKKKSISEELLDQRRTDLAVSQADTLGARETAEQAALDVEHCVARSPLAAVVSERLVSVGSHVTAGIPLVGLIETAAPEVTVALRQDQLPGFLAAADRAFEHNGESRPLTLRAVLPAADTITRTREARLTFAAETAIPGTAGRVVWRGGIASIPADYLVRRGGQLGIFVLDDDQANFVTIPSAQEGRAAPVQGLSADTRLITEGRQRLSHGDKVKRVDGE